MPSAIGSLFSSPSTPSISNNTANVYQPTGTSSLDTLFQNLINQSTSNNPYTTYTPQATATYNAQANNPYAALYQQMANTGGQQFNTTGTMDAANSTALTNTGNTALTGANQTLQMGFDPQSALYNQTQQQVMDQANATNAMSGTGTSPYGSSVTNQANTNFNIDWQNQQLSRALQALSGYTNAATGAQNNFTGADTLGQASATNENNAGALPFTAANQITGNQSTALQNLLQVIGSGDQSYTQTDLLDIMSYLGLGAVQSDQQAQNALQVYADQVQQQQAAASGVGSLLGAGASAYGNYAGLQALATAATAAAT